MYENVEFDLDLKILYTALHGHIMNIVYKAQRSKLSVVRLLGASKSRKRTTMIFFFEA